MAKQANSILLRSKTDYLKRRVPARFSDIETRKLVWISLGTDSLTEAENKAIDVWKEQVAGWDAKLAGKHEKADEHFAAVVKLAELKGYKYLPVISTSELPESERLNRIEAITLRGGKLDLEEAYALIGSLHQQGLTISKALEEFWELARDEQINKSEDQKRKWRNPRIKAISNFIDLIGDKELSEITREDALEFRGWWMDRVEYEGLTPNSANKDLGGIKKILETVSKKKGLGLELPFYELRLQDHEQQRRPSFSDEWIRDQLLATGALDGLNLEARAVFLVMINTGARLSEISNLLPEQIFLDHEFPHVDILPISRELKSKNARRKLPLVGCSLNAMKTCPEGFPRYRDTSSISAVINKYLRENDLKETPQHVIYSLRHSFEDRLRKAKVDERLRSRLFGHSYYREEYGEPSLEELTEAVRKVAF